MIPTPKGDLKVHTRLILQELLKKYSLVIDLTGRNNLMFNLVVGYCFCDIFPGKEHARTLHCHKASV